MFLFGSLADARENASSAKFLGTPSISNKIFPGLTLAAQNSTAPFPLPCLTSAGFFVTGTSGNILIHTRPDLFRCLEIHLLADSICLEVILAGVRAFKP